MLRADDQRLGTVALYQLRSAPGSRGFQSRRRPQSEQQFLELVELASHAGVNFMEFSSYDSYDISRLRRLDAALKANMQHQPSP